MEKRRMGPRTVARLIAGAVTLVVVVVTFRGTVFSWPALFWPPGGERWFTLAMVWLISLAVPAMLGAAAGGLVYDRFG